eukprot:921943-Pleurochrysis_carterae.AAC.1
MRRTFSVAAAEASVSVAAADLCSFSLSLAGGSPADEVASSGRIGGEAASFAHEEARAALAGAGCGTTRMVREESCEEGAEEA